MWVSLDRNYLFYGDVWDFPLLGDTLLKGFDSLIVLWKVVESGEKWMILYAFVSVTNHMSSSH